MLILGDIKKIPSKAISFILLLAIVATNAFFSQLFAQSKQQVLSNFSVLNKYSTDLTEIARQNKLRISGNFEAEINQLVKALSNGGARQPVILDTVGKDQILVVESLASRIAKGEVPANLENKRVLKLELDTIFDSSKSIEEKSQIIEKVFAELAQSNDEIILFVDELANFAGKTQINNSLIDLLAQGKLHIIGGSSAATYQENVASIAEVADMFAPITIGKSGLTDKEVFRERRNMMYRGDNVASDIREMMANDPTGGEKRIDVIVQSKNADRGEIYSALRENNVRRSQRIGQSDAFVANMSLNEIQTLSQSGAVNYISPDRPTAMLGHIETTTGSTLVRSSGTENGVTSLDGSGVGIAVLDSGIWTGHKAFLGTSGQNRVVYQQNFVTGQSITNDNYGHGTHVAAIAAGNENRDNNKYRGIAYNANIINLRVLNNQGKGKTSDLLAALDWLDTNGRNYNIRVVNLSLGTAAIDSWYNDSVGWAAAYLNWDGMLVVAAAGNNGKDSNGKKTYGQIHSPGNNPSVITVGASNTKGTDSRSDDVVTTYSSRGPTRSYYTSGSTKVFDHLTKPDIVAPGNKIISAKANGTNNLLAAFPSLTNSTLDYSTSDNEDMMYLSGTSMSTPMVSGAATLLFQLNSNFTPTQVKMLLEYTAQPLNGFNMFEQGAGQLNIEGAIRLANVLSYTANFTNLSNGASTTRTSTLPTTSSTIAGGSVTWAQGIVVKGGYLKGTNLFTKWSPTFRNYWWFEDGISNSSDGTPVLDTSLYTSGITAYKDIKKSNGTSLGGGSVFMSSGVIMGDGVVMGDGVIFGDGVLISDGVLVSDGVLMGDSTTANTNEIFAEGDDTTCMQ